MVSILDVLALIGMAIVRFGIPIALTALAVYFLKRLDRRWEEEARAAQRARQEMAVSAEKPLQPQPSRRPESPVRAPGPALPPFIHPPAPSATYAQQGMMVATAPLSRCWDVKGCTEAAMEKCAAPQHPGQPCWQARWAADGSIPEECAACDIFQRYPMM